MSPEQDLDKLFAQYRTACPDVEPGANFMPEVWRRIEARRGFWPAFEHLARVALAICAAACLVFGLLVFANSRHSVAAEQTYADALAADQTAELAFYADPVHVNNASWDTAR